MDAGGKLVHSAENKEPERVRRMFDRVARRYDLLNHVLSANLDRRWRRRALEPLGKNPQARVLDLCGGTGDLSIELVRGSHAGAVVCCDFSHAMLLAAGPKLERQGFDGSIQRVEADGLNLPFPDRSFDAVTVAFGVRNLQDMSRGFREMLRVLQPGGKLVVLEFSQPTAPILSGLYRFYLDRVLPRIGAGVSGNEGPYRYLARTIADFPAAPELAGSIREAGFAACEWATMSGGVVAAHTAVKHLR
jgi:demethylmenaquinone methyltransferase/2-methoxy-6-polyprenyl-1,4-benzoquinol methylase